MRHSIRRLKERYGENFDTADRDRITELIKSGHGIRCAKKSDRVQNYAVHYGGAWLYVGWNPQKQKLRTALPLNDATRAEIITGFLRREQGERAKSRKMRGVRKREKLFLLERRYRSGL